MCFNQQWENDPGESVPWTPDPAYNWWLYDRNRFGKMKRHHTRWGIDFGKRATLAKMGNETKISSIRKFQRPVAVDHSAKLRFRQEEAKRARVRAYKAERERRAQAALERYKLMAKMAAGRKRVP
jgi:hypothetical protein